jgi:signal transduction histidine kinase
LTQAAAFLQNLAAAGFVALGVAIAYRWYRERGRAQAMLALALITLAVVAGLGRFADPQHPSLILSVIEIAGFLVSGYFVLLFRNEFIPLRRREFQAANLLLGLSIVVGIVDVILLPRSDSWVTTLIGLELIGTWAIFTGEPIVRFWLASRRLPAVQRARMRFLSFGFAVLIAILFISVLGGSALRSPTAIIVTELIVLAVVPAIYVSFAPPALLRRIWRMSEEDELRAAIQDLLIFSPTRNVLAERAITWAVRLLGGNAGFITDPRGNVMAHSGIDPARAAHLLAVHTAEPEQSPDRVVVVPLPLTDGQGSLGVVAGPFTPLFGTEEIAQLRAYAFSVSAGLERARVTERMAAIESNKTQFLNLASHELRGPVTVIRGYVSMLEGGLLGQLNERGRKAAGVMSAKVSEMNELIEEMIEAARLEDGGLNLKLVEADLRDIARAAAESVAPMVDPSHTLELDLPDRRVRVNVDADRTKTIIANLLSNAIKYSPAGGPVALEVKARGGVARVAVSDRGLGIANENMATLFTRFGRVITPETEHLKGTGLGLFLGRQLARLQGGDITVMSTAGQGSTFTLHLPAASPADGSPNGAASDGSSHREEPVIERRARTSRSATD